ncbi:ArsR/SmtB family transcription factor [Haloarchaeobius sp. DFWS5]|uniref:ArsR/SmtB family transcription factor n=1 Tax=Haloarchaeobius sp. DFWS5 TaxID=3446114 RepID=UPI003EBEAD24
MSSDDAAATTEDVFEVLSSELRLSVLRELAAAEREGQPVLSFSELYDRVDAEGTPQFSYHLSRLAGHFVWKTDEGYRLAPAGDRVVRAVVSGAYEGNPTFEPTTIEGHCPACPSTTLDAALDDGLLVVSCADCEMQVVSYDLPPGQALDRDSETVLYECDRRVRHEYAMALDGICSGCGGEMEIRVERTEETPVPTHMAISHCTVCDLQVFAPVETRLLYHPAVVSLYWRHGVDATAIPLWSLWATLEPWETTVESLDPFEAAVRVVVEDDSLTVHLDAHLEVTVDADRTEF